LHLTVGVFPRKDRPNSNQWQIVTACEHRPTLRYLTGPTSMAKPKLTQAMADEAVADHLARCEWCSKADNER
jgi:hypothetical protein